ncbi:MAG: hypothetical protein ACI9WU_005284, partial [Myxococcota bacterium]
MIALIVMLALAAPPEKSPDWKRLLAEGERLTLDASPKVQLKGARLKAKAFELEPNRVETAAGMCHAYFIRIFFEKNRQKAQALGMKGARMAEKVAKRWPKRAEGYYWIAANNGALAKHIGVIEAVSQGLGGTIERAALKALELDRTLYGGSVLRLLGRYYTLIPWPLRNTDKAVKLLTEAHELMPANMAGVQFLAEALTLSGDKDK